MWFLYAFLSSISWSCMTIFGKLASQRIDPHTLTLLRSILTSAILISTAVLTQNPSFEHLGNIQSKDWVFITLAAISSSFAWTFYFSAFKYGFISKVVSIDRLNFVFIILLSAYIFGEDLSWTMILGASLIIIGIVLVAMA